MDKRRHWPQEPGTAHEGADDVPAFVPQIDTEEIFKQLINDELRSGRLTPARRRRIVRYAAGLGLSAVQAGRLVETCRNKALYGDDPTERFHALHLVEPREEQMPIHVKIALLVAGAVLLDVLLVMWML